MIHIEPGEESLPHIISDLREESLQQIVSGIHDPHDLLQNLSEQDVCLDSKDLIHWERNAADLYDQRDSRRQMSFISFKEGIPNDHSVGKMARNILNQLQVKFPAYHLLHAMRSGTFGTEHLDWYSCNCTCYPQFSNFIGIQSSFKMCLHLTNVLW